MPELNTIVLYVSDFAASVAFYTELLGKGPDQSSSNFAGFALENGVVLGLWSKAKALPEIAEIGVGGEIVFAVADRNAVDTAHAAWSGRGVAIAQAPVQLDFGYTFVALDPDGHRLRVFFPTLPA
jgi:catechol 2,3-dioxygenase-like lactoylglutathione lyase family enzyme